MATTTTNLGLTKPVGTEQALISVINGNMDIIDSKVGAVPANKNVQGEIDSLSDQIGALNNSKTLGILSTLADLKSAILSETNNLNMRDRRPIHFTTSFSESGFINGATYDGDLWVNSKGANYLYFSCLFCGVGSSSCTPVYTMYNNGTWLIKAVSLT